MATQLKIKQIAAIQDEGKETLYAVCEDGSLWSNTLGRGGGPDLHWSGWKELERPEHPFESAPSHKSVYKTS